MGSRENTKQKKNKRSNKVFGAMEKVHSKTGHIGEGKRLKKCKGSSRGIWRKIEYRSKTIREVGLGRGKRF